MKKNLVAVAVASALVFAAAANAETTLYGSVRMDVDYTNPDAKGADASWDVKNEGSRLGVKGSEDLGGGLKAIYQYEFGVRADGSTEGPFSQRLSWVGLTGGFGTVAIGRQETPAYTFVGSNTDIFNGPVTNPWSPSTEILQRRGNVVSYVTPSFSGFTAAGALIMDQNNGVPFPYNPANENTGSDSVDHYQVAAKYENTFGNLGVLLGGYFHDAQEASFAGNGDDIWIWGVGGTLTFGDFSLGATYEKFDDKGTGDHNDYAGYGLIAGFDFGANTIRGGWGRMEPDINSLDDYDTWEIGFEHRLSKRTRLWVEYVDTEIPAYLSEFDVVGTDGQIKGGSNLALGIRHDF